MESLHMMGWGLVLAENSSIVAAAVVVAIASITGVDSATTGRLCYDC